MGERMVNCAKLGREMPGLDEATADGRQALKVALLLGGPELQQRVREHISAEAWGQWRERMRMVINEYQLDPTSDDSNAILRQHLVDFLFGKGDQVRNYVPPKQP